MKLPPAFSKTARAAAVLLAVTAALHATAQQAVLPPLDRALLGEALPDARVLVTGFQFEGNTAIPAGALQSAVSEFVGRELTMEELEEVRRRVTLLYVQKGFINSGAILPDQTITEGVVKLQVVEGKLSELNLTHAAPSSQPTTRPAGWHERLDQRLVRRLDDGYLRPRIWRNPDKPLDVTELKDNLEIIRQNPNVKRINAELRPGAAPGESVLDVAVEENNPWQAALNFNNRRAPTIGAERFELFLTNTNLLGLSDTLAFRYALTKGGIEDMEFSDSDDFSIDYELPFTPRDTAFFVGYTRSDELVFQEPEVEIDITSTSDLFDIGLRQPVFRSPNSELVLSLALSVRHNTTTLLGERFDFTPKPDSSAVRFAQQYATRNIQRAVALRSTFSFGIDAFDATITDRDDVADSEFFAWLGQVQYVRRIGESDNQLILRLSTQLTPDPLLTVEQFPIGGMDTVRGYRENQLVRDNAAVATAELRIPLVQRSGLSVLDIAPFFDAGYGWNDVGDDDEELISSAGLGLLWNPSKHVSGTLYWGFPFRKFDEGDDEDLQDWGFHFTLTVFAF